jgi:non-specific serine/threonine protein kinase
MAANRDKIRKLLEAALDCPPDRRAAFLDEACSSDAALRAQVEALLAAAASSGDSSLAEAGPPLVPTDISPTEIGADNAAPPVLLELGTVVDGRYRVDAVIGAGGMGAVYRATDLQLERPVALKMIRSDLLSNRAMAERFRREAVAVARLRHPHIVTVHDYGVAPDVGAFIVMELLDGHSLRTELLRRSRLDLGTAMLLMRQVFAAVGAAHSAGVIHRDLKPENIVLELRDGARSVKVVDFGLAKLGESLLSSDAPLTLAEAVFGTPAYMSPEQCTGEAVDVRSDVYALGCVFYEMLTGQPPFAGRPVMALLYKHVNEPPPRPSDIAPDLSPSLDEALMSALAKRPGDRYQTIEAFERALGAAVDDDAHDTVVVGRATEPGLNATAAVDAAWVGRWRPNNLPLATSRFIGREPQIDEVRGRIADARLVTLVGPGGIGKTRLSLEVAARVLGDSDDAVWFVELAPLADPELVVQSVAKVLGVREQDGRLTPESLTAWLRDRRVLLVLDNCEHLVEACASLVDSLLRSCSGLRVLATSREPLGVTGEAVWPVPALTVPAGGTSVSPPALGEFEATRLFVERATLVRPGFAVREGNAAAIAEVCRRLDGIPLAIELAAARAKVLSVEQIADKLDDRFALLAGGNRTAPKRQQTLRAAIDWSHDLLSDTERGLFRRLAVFAGGFSLAAVEAVAGGDVLDPLTRLVETSLVVAESRDDGSVRYRTFETVREYAAERLREAGEESDVRRRHRDWFLQLAEDAEPKLTGPDQVAWIARLEDEHDNLAAALRWSVDHAGDWESGLRLCYALGRFWSVRAHLSEGRAWIERVLSMTPDPRHPLRTRVLLWSSQLARLQGDSSVARSRLEESRALAEALGDRLGVGAALNEAFIVELHAQDVDRAEAAAQGSLEAFEEVGDRRGIGLAGTALAIVASEHGDFDRAIALYESALESLREVGDSRSISTILHNLGRVVASRGQLEQGRLLVSEGLSIARDLNDLTAMAVFSHSLGRIAAMAGDFDEALRHYAEALPVYREYNAVHMVAELLESIASVAIQLREFRRAARFIGAAAAIREVVGIGVHPEDRDEFDSDLATLQQALEAGELEAAMDEGRAMSIDDAIADARAARIAGRSGFSDA